MSLNLKPSRATIFHPYRIRLGPRGWMSRSKQHQTILWNVIRLMKMCPMLNKNSKCSVGKKKLELWKKEKKKSGVYRWHLENSERRKMRCFSTVIVFCRTLVRRDRCFDWVALTISSPSLIHKVSPLFLFDHVSSLFSCMSFLLLFFPCRSLWSYCQDKSHEEEGKKHQTEMNHS